MNDTCGGREEPETTLSVGVVVPAYNFGRFIAETVDSILAQTYPNVRCLVMDGGSTDDTVAILKSYGDAIEFVSAPDGGQADAIDRGFRRLTVDLVGWLNADDTYFPEAVSRVVEAAEENPDAVLFHGDAVRITVEGRPIGNIRSRAIDYDRIRTGRGPVVQPGSFYRKSAVLRCGGVDPRYELLMDVDLWIRLLREGRAVRIPESLARFRVHADAKSSSGSVYRYYLETLRLGWTYERDRLVRGMARRFVVISRTHARILATELARWVRRERRANLSAGVK